MPSISDLLSHTLASLQPSSPSRLQPSSILPPADEIAPPLPATASFASSTSSLALPPPAAADCPSFRAGPLLHADSLPPPITHCLASSSISVVAACRHLSGATDCPSFRAGPLLHATPSLHPITHRLASSSISTVASSPHVPPPSCTTSPSPLLSSSPPSSSPNSLSQSLPSSPTPSPISGAKLARLDSSPPPLLFSVFLAGFPLSTSAFHPRTRTVVRRPSKTPPSVTSAELPPSALHPIQDRPLD